MDDVILGAVVYELEVEKLCLRFLQIDWHRALRA